MMYECGRKLYTLFAKQIILIMYIWPVIMGQAYTLEVLWATVLYFRNAF